MGVAALEEAEVAEAAEEGFRHLKDLRSRLLVQCGTLLS